jgi:hypothetical protein
MDSEIVVRESLMMPIRGVSFKNEKLSLDFITTPVIYISIHASRIFDCSQV